MSKRLWEKELFVHWYERSAVRKSEQVRLLPSVDKLFFSPELVPVSQHPLLVERGEETVRKFLVYHLLTYLHFTEHLEHDVINKVAAKLAKKQYALDVPQQAQLGAYKLYVDEGYHALFSADLQFQIRNLLGIELTLTGPPSFLTRLDEKRSSVSPESRWLVDVFFSIVSETLISKPLSKIPMDDRVVNAVRNLVADHAVDEAIHHAYFAGLLAFLWPQLGTREQCLIGSLLPDFIVSFLEPDRTALRANLVAVGLSLSDANAAIEDSYPSGNVLSDIRSATGLTLRHFRNCGVFENKCVAEAFMAIAPAAAN